MLSLGECLPQIAPVRTRAGNVIQTAKHASPSIGEADPSSRRRDGTPACMRLCIGLGFRFWQECAADEVDQTRQR